jgi:hypothetical protein
MFAQSNKENAAKLNIKAVSHGIRMGWFMWPVNFDPTWLLNCDGFTEKELTYEKRQSQGGSVKNIKPGKNDKRTFKRRLRRRMNG